MGADGASAEFGCISFQAVFSYVLPQVLSSFSVFVKLRSVYCSDLDVLREFRDLNLIGSGTQATLRPLLEPHGQPSHGWSRAGCR